ncbi:MAG: hypothetical protein K0R05_4013, partial [Anaerocolumna sp.]|nr:hypothetical protein [Anaerocolumna sp.]
MKTDLKFQNGKFKIMQFTDLHYVDGSSVDEKTINLMRRLLAIEKPDFVMITGDTVYGSDNLGGIDKALEPLVEAEIPWSLVFGNHDDEEGVEKEELIKKVMDLQGSLVFHAEDSGFGIGNHYLEIKNGNNETSWVLFGIDSGSYNVLPGIVGYDYVRAGQIEWYRKTIKELVVSNSDFASLVFLHIPLPEYKEVWESKSCIGNKLEEVCCSAVNSGFFTALLEEGHTRGVFAGHDHINDYIGDLHGIQLGYGRATGYNTYGRDGFL